MFLHEQDTRARRMHCDAMNAVPDLGGRVGQEVGLQSIVDRPPVFAGVVGAERAGGRDGDEDTSRLSGIQKYGMQAHAARARLPTGSRAVAAQAGKFLPALPAVG
jgi:hypothetical protein